MSSTLAAILAHCKDDPFDDDRRLVLADWLADHSQDVRAEFVRLQVAASHDYGTEPERPARDVRIGQLERQHQAAWTGPLVGRYQSFRWERGLLEIRATAQQLDAHPVDALPADVLPWVEGLYLEHSRSRLAQVLAHPQMGCFARIECAGSVGSGPKFTDADLTPLWTNLALADLRDLDLSYNSVTADTVEALRTTPALAGLRRLNLSSTGLGEEVSTLLGETSVLCRLSELDVSASALSGVGLALLLSNDRCRHLRLLAFDSTTLDNDALAGLARSEHLGRVDEVRLDAANLEAADWRLLAEPHSLRPRQLGLFYTEMSEDAVVGLLSSPLVERVETLSLAGGNLTLRTAEALARSPYLRRLKRLRYWEELGDAGLALLVGSPNAANLVELGIPHASITAAGATTLANATTLSNLAVLGLNDNALGDAGLTALANGRGLPKLVGLAIEETGVGVDGLTALARSPLARQLRYLELSSSKLRNREIEALAQWPTGSALESLDLNSNKIGHAGMQALAQCAGLANLVELKLYNNRIRDAGALALVRSPYLQKLGWLDLRKNGLTAKSGVALRDWPLRLSMSEFWYRDNEFGRDLDTALLRDGDTLDE